MSVLAFNKLDDAIKSINTDIIPAISELAGMMNTGLLMEDTSGIVSVQDKLIVCKTDLDSVASTMATNEETAKKYEDKLINGGCN